MSRRAVLVLLLWATIVVIGGLAHDKPAKQAVECAPAPIPTQQTAPKRWLI